MRYKDYKIENLTFMKGTDSWSIDEKREFLETCPENEELSKAVEDLKELKTALDEGLVKQNKYGEINKNSLKAYLSKRKTNIKYGRPWRSCLFSDDKDFYINVDGSYEIFATEWKVTDLIKDYEDGGDVEYRFSNLASSYAKKENDFAKNVENNRYRATHTDRITANKKCDAVLKALNIDFPVSLKEDYSFGIYGGPVCETSRLRMYDYPYSRNEYGEIMINNVPLTENQATELTEMILEMSKKISDVIEDYRPSIDKALGKSRG